MSVKNLLPYQAAGEVARLKQAGTITVHTLPTPRYTRIDFQLMNVGVTLGEHTPRWGYRVAKFIDGWTANTPPHELSFDPPIKSTDGQEQPFNLDTALAALRARGWTVHRWPTGARAWLGPVLPVRNRDQIAQLRTRLTRNLIALQGHTDLSTQVDLAFDY